MKLDRTDSHHEIKQIMLHPEIFKTIAEDGLRPSDLIIDTEEEAWVTVRVKGKLIGLYNFHPHNKVTLEIHAHILPEHRKEHSIKSGKMALEWFIEHCDYGKLIAQVPVKYENVKNFCLANGFVVEGVNRMSHIEGGVIMDMTLLGVTRAEVEEFLSCQN